jgi:hypothetical protein
MDFQKVKNWRKRTPKITVDILPALKDGDSNSENHATHD